MENTVIFAALAILKNAHFQTYDRNEDTNEEPQKKHVFKNQVVRRQGLLLSYTETLSLAKGYIVPLITHTNSNSIKIYTLPILKNLSIQ